MPPTTDARRRLATRSPTEPKSTSLNNVTSTISTLAVHEIRDNRKRPHADRGSPKQVASSGGTGAAPELRHRRAAPATAGRSSMEGHAQAASERPRVVDMPTCRGHCRGPTAHLPCDEFTLEAAGVGTASIQRRPSSPASSTTRPQRIHAAAEGPSPDFNSVRPAPGGGRLLAFASQPSRLVPLRSSRRSAN